MATENVRLCTMDSNVGMSLEIFPFISRHLVCFHKADAEESFRRLDVRGPIVKI